MWRALMSAATQPDPIFIQEKPWENNENTVWLGSTLSILRNVEKFKFPAKLEGTRQKQLISLSSKELLSSQQLTNPRLIRAEDITPLQKQYLSEHFMTTQSFQQTHAGEAFVVDDSGEFLAALNIHDHLYLQLTDCKGELENSWNRLVKIETFLGKTMSYAFSPKYGFLTSDFTQSGTGFLISAFLQLPTLIHTGKLGDTLIKYKDESIMLTGMQGNPNELIGDLLVVRNNYTLGVTEENIISSLRSFTTKMVLEENSVRKKISEEESPKIKDKVSRAFAILIHSYQIEVIEALNAISLLKLGIDLGWITGTTIVEVNKLFLHCRQAHLMLKCPETIKPEELPHKRAEYIHKFLKEVHLTI